MNNTFYFYDLETSGFNPREARIMQFAGQRTDMNLIPMGEPHNILIKMTDDVVPEPDAVLITKITPQMTIQDGITEAEFLKIFSDEIAIPETIFVGFNSVRFDDEFMRFLLYRNFYDAYEWQWTENKSRWDLLDLVRMTRALRPEGIEWPFDSDGKPTNRLELLASMNNLTHDKAHDALSDVIASIEVAKLIKSKQPKLFDYLLNLRDKKKVQALVTSRQAFVYTSGKYASEHQKTTVVATVCEHPNQPGAALVYDLRYDPEEWSSKTAEELAESWHRRRDDPGPRLPVKTLKYNRCPAIAELRVLDKASQTRLQINLDDIKTNLAKLQTIHSDLSSKLQKAVDLLDKKQQARLIEDQSDAETRLYEAFIDNDDKSRMNKVRRANVDEISELSPQFKDQRLQAIFPLYKARNFQDSLSGKERLDWGKYRQHKLLSGGESSRLARYFARLGELDASKNLTSEQKYLLEELQLYGQSIIPDQV